ncbi:MAG: lipopolysaccharide biosynthesis protein [Gemmatimonadetes bacterium]|nr:lipopolysaccharide biosynthesis protein [Gemmatimonadota bacterium]
MRSDVNVAPAAATPAAAPPERDPLDRALLRGIAWTGALRWATQILNWSITIVLARILTPGDYGLYGFTALYVGLVQLVNEFGLGAAIIRRRDLSDDQISALGGMSLALGVGLWGLSFLAAPLVAQFFHAPALAGPLILQSFLFVTTAVKVLPKSIMSRDMQFRRVAALDASEQAVSGISMLVLALLGGSYWSLMGGMVLGGVFSMALAVYWKPHRLGWPARWSEVSSAVTFGTHIMVARLAWYGYSNGDNAVVGKRLGQVLLGSYVHAWTLASLPVDRISALVSQVTPAIFSAVQDDRPKLRRYLLKITEGLALLTFPVAMGLASVADLFVVVVMGDRWWPAIAPLAILSFYGAFRSLTSTLPHALQAVGEAGRAMRYNLLGLAVLLPLFLAGSRWGLAGVAGAWVIGYPLVTWPMLRAVQRVTDMRLSDLAEAIRPSMIAATAMMAMVAATRALLPARTGLPAQFFTAVGVGALTYVLVLILGFRERLAGVRALVGELRR